MGILNTIPTIEVLPDTSNWDFIQLLNDGEPAELRSVESIVIILDTCTQIDSAATSGVITWGETQGVVGIRLGRWKNWPVNNTRLYYGKLMVYDPICPKGLMWGTLRIRLLRECSA
jgi:hypothetical protein